MCFPVNFAKFLRTPFYGTSLGNCLYNKKFSLILGLEKGNNIHEFFQKKLNFSFQP